MIKFTGRLKRASYWKELLVACVGFLLSVGLFSWLLDIQDADVPGAPTANVVLAFIFLGLVIASTIYFYLVFVGAIIRRAHDTRNSMVWMLVGLFLPFGVVVTGWIPSKR